MSTSYAERAAALYPNNPAYQQAWLRMVNFLGSKWLLAAKPTPRPKEHP